jgi:hypothetical protein
VRPCAHASVIEIGPEQTGAEEVLEELETDAVADDDGHG